MEDIRFYSHDSFFFLRILFDIFNATFHFCCLKLVSAIFIEFLYMFSPNDSPSKIMKNAFYFIKKALFVLEIIKFFFFRPSLFFSLSAITLEDDRR